MPAARSRQSKAKRPRIPSEDRTDGPEKRPRNGAESPLSSSPNSIHALRDRSLISWKHKGKWRERTPKRTPMSLAQAADDLFTGTSAQGALVNAALSSQQLDTSIVEIASTIHGSSPISPKDVPIPETPIMNQKEEELQLEIQRLRSQLEQKDQVIFRHESTIETVQNCVYCPICLDPLWRPFVLVPCGHMACQGCLISWFTSPPPGQADEPDPPPIRQKRKTCPHCRGTVTMRPVEVYGLGGAVAALHPQPLQPPPEADTDAPIDPWADVFRPPPVGRAVRDEEDGGVRRCPACFYEIFDGECVGCGRAFSDVTAHTAFGSDDGSVSVFDDDRRSIYGPGGGSLYGGTLYGDERSDDGSGRSLYEAEVPVFDYPPRARVYDSYDEDEDEDDSFIDDAELPRPPPAAYFNHYAVSDSEEEAEETGYLSAHDSRSSPLPPRRANSYTCSSSSSDLSDDDDDDEEEDDFLPGRGRRGRSVEVETLPETADEADDEDSVNPNVTIDILSDDDDEPPVRLAGRRSAAERWGGWSRDDGEPPRGRSLSRRRVMSPEDGSENGSEYFSD
ncbi:Tripartite motif-containing protein 55 [Rhizoctonia solani]|uniref:Tripartite motif-containing protein 55 n=1 Tax=Rhizoctonia solani TaxID=456999 RepID=A0A0K6GFZ2_9AGAM|nr:Tripartite motif-containing protein 55 [Rhizoctonia solani]